MNGRLLILILALTGTMCFAQKGPDLRQNKKELDKIKQHLQETTHQVDSLKNVESNLLKKIAGYGEQVNRNRKLINKLEGELKSVRSSIDNAQNDIEATSQALEAKKSRFYATIRQYYISYRGRQKEGAWNPQQEMELSRLNHYLSSVSIARREQIKATGDTLTYLARTVADLKQTSSELTKERSQKKAKVNLDLTLKDQEETSLGGVRRQASLLQDRLVFLSEMAQQMEEIIARLEQEHRRRQLSNEPQVRLRSGSFKQLQGQLRPPVRGKIVDSFGWKTDAITNLKSFSPGILIKPRQEVKEVVAAGPGRVVYVGRLRGYENFVILEHDDGYFTTYAGLSSVFVDLGELVNTGQALGAPGSGEIRFEIRHEREHLDPVIWLNIDEF